MNPCINNDVHSFQPRYDEFEGMPACGIKEAGRWQDAGPAAHFLNSLRLDKKKTYIYDICIKCGEIIQRPPEKACIEQ